MGTYKIDFAADQRAAAAGELTLHIGSKNRSGRAASWPGPATYTRLGGSPDRPKNVVRLAPDHLDR